MFLGTPHRGSKAASVGEVARKAANLLLMDTNSRILDSLSLRNDDLQRCQYVFSSLWSKYNFQVKTFQENLPLKIPTRLGQSKMVKVSFTNSYFVPMQTATDSVGDVRWSPTSHLV